MSSPAFNVIKNSLIVRAGAGAGKTTLLIQTFIDFCHAFELEHGKLPKIAITTFTRKATQEIKERLSVKALEKDDKILFQHINKKSMVHISTIHGLLTLLVQENADLLGLPQKLKIVDHNIYKKSIKKIVRQHLKNSAECLEILEHYPFLRTVDLLIQLMEALRQKPDLTFISVQQLQDLSKKKLIELKGYLQNIFQIFNDHKPQFSEAWVDYIQYLMQLFNNLEIPRIEDAIQLFEEKPTKPRRSKKDCEALTNLHEGIDIFWREFDLSAADTISYFNNHEKLAGIFLKLAQAVNSADRLRKLNTGEITINDLELFSVELTRHFPQAVSDFSHRFDYYMIDEFQDTSPLQVEILDKIMQDKPHFIVGDPQQSIYLFRGARAEVFLAKQNLVETNKNVKIKYLDINYRSDPQLMCFINDYFQHMNTQFESMKVNTQKTIADSAGSASSITKTQIAFMQADDEAAGVLQHISSLLNKGINAKDICVLSRRNHNLMKVANLAQKINIPVQWQVSAGFDQKREILDLISILKFLINPHDNENLVLLLRSPWAYLSDAEIAHIAQPETAKQMQLKQSLWINLLKSYAHHPTLKLLHTYFLDYHRIGASAALTEFIKISGFLDNSAVYDSSGKREANYWKFFMHLKNAERQIGFFLGRYVSDNFQFLQSDLGSGQTEAIPVAQPDRVSLLTIHAAKGLEFPHVVVVGFSEAPLLTLYQPLSISIETEKFSLAPFIISESKNTVSRWGQGIRKDFNIKESLEHERLLYVALTRAKNSLALVAENKSRQFANCWKNKSIWPGEGLHVHENYDLQCLTVGNDLQVLSTLAKNFSAVRDKLNFTKAENKSTSVTESIQNAEFTDGMAIDYKKKIADLIKAKKGTDLHRLFESLQIYSKNKDLYNSLTAKLSSEEKKAVQYLMAVKEFPLLQLIQNGFVEWGFGIETTTGLIQGQIDLWGIYNNEIYILDYKTGSSQNIEKAYQQLLFYAHCLYKMKQLDLSMPLNFVVTYPLEEKTLSKSFAHFEELKAQTPHIIQNIFA